MNLGKGPNRSFACYKTRLACPCWSEDPAADHGQHSKQKVEEEVGKVHKWSNGEVCTIIDNIAVPADNESWFWLALVYMEQTQKEDLLLGIRYIRCTLHERFLPWCNAQSWRLQVSTWLKDLQASLYGLHHRELWEAWKSEEDAQSSCAQWSSMDSRETALLTHRSQDGVYLESVKGSIRNACQERWIYVS